MLPGPVPRSVPRSPRPHRVHLLWRGRAGRRGAECPRDRSCRRAHRSGKQAPPSPCSRASSEGSGSYLVLLGSSPITIPLAIFESAPEVRVLCSAGITRPQRSNDPVRLPPKPPPEVTLRPLPSPTTGLPLQPRTTLPTCCAHYPGGSSRCACRLLPRSCSLPQMAGGSASALSLSRPAQALRVLRPVGSLSHPR